MPGVPDPPKVLLYGNEAIARGAYEAGVRVASGYPGTPATEIIETLAGFDQVYVEWSPNEKVALDVAIGASLGGARAMASMKHVGVNVAADPLLTSAYVGVNAGLVLVSADDPGMHSSQNEQDNRWYGKFARLPVLEPASSQEARDFTAAAFELSERFDTPVILRTTTRISHARSPVPLRERVEAPARPWRKDAEKNVMLPAHARQRKPVVEQRLEDLRIWAETTNLNRLDWPVQPIAGRAPRGFVSGGIACHYVREAFPDAPLFKLGLSYPLPGVALRDFAARVERLYVVEELDPFWEAELRWFGLEPVGKAIFPSCGELSTALVREAVLSHEAAEARRAEGAGRPGQPGAESAGGAAALAASEGAPLPSRPPVLCPGCPHRAVLHVLRKLRLHVMGDIGCYTLGALPPLAAVDACTCMGASVGLAMGLRRALPPEEAARVVAIIGDSTFVHSGIPPLIDAVYSRSDAVVIILDNGTTAMTGHQGHPASGLDVHGLEAPRLILEDVVRACGVGRVKVLDPHDLGLLERTLREYLVPGQGPAVIIARRPCVLLRGAKPAPRRVTFEDQRCKECGACLRIGCPGLTQAGKKPELDVGLCTACGLCAAVCPSGALVVTDEGGGRG